MDRPIKIIHELSRGTNTGTPRQAFMQSKAQEYCPRKPAKFPRELSCSRRGSAELQRLDRFFCFTPSCA